MNEVSARFPDLFREIFWEWGPMYAQFALCEDAPTPISNVNLIPYTREGWVVLRLDNGEYTMPGGTLEPNETYVEALHRELLEEAGARILNFKPLGAWNCRSLAEKPYRPHLPHPDFYRYVCVGEVELVGKPLNPSDAEQVVSVDVVSLEEIVRRFQTKNRAEMAQLYQLAAARR
jgi:8-oxo-dGTP diphosphatase